jgi:hypothetical protein
MLKFDELEHFKNKQYSKNKHSLCKALIKIYSGASATLKAMSSSCSVCSSKSGISGISINRSKQIAY